MENNLDSSEADFIASPQDAEVLKQSRTDRQVQNEVSICSLLDKFWGQHLLNF